MPDVISIAIGLSTQVKIGWAVLLLWGSVLVEWYCRGRIITPTVRPPRRRQVSVADDSPAGEASLDSPGDSSIASA